MNKQSNKNLKFDWELREKYGRNFAFWKSDVKKISLYGFSKYTAISAFAFYQLGLNEPNTAYATFCLSIEPRNTYYLHKHFNGKNASLKARAWCNQLLNNTPNYCEVYQRKEVDHD